MTEMGSETFLTAEEARAKAILDDARIMSGVAIRPCENGGRVVIVPSDDPACWPWYHYFDSEEQALAFRDKEVEKWIQNRKGRDA